MQVNGFRRQWRRVQKVTQQGVASFLSVKSHVRVHCVQQHNINGLPEDLLSIMYDCARLLALLHTTGSYAADYPPARRLYVGTAALPATSKP